MALQVEAWSIELIELLRPIVARIRRHDRSLADQMRRAASSIALNIAEGAYSDPGNRKARYSTAAGSASETRAALRVSVAWGYCAASEAERAETLVERVIAMLWRLTQLAGELEAGISVTAFAAVTVLVVASVAGTDPVADAVTDADTATENSCPSALIQQ